MKKKDIYCQNNLWAQRETNFVRLKKEDLCTLSFYSEYWGLVSRRAWMKAFRSFSLSFFPSSRCSWRSARTRQLEAARGWGWEGLIHFLVVGSSFGVMMITSNLVLLFLFSWASRRLLSHTVKISQMIEGILCIRKTTNFNEEYHTVWSVNDGLSGNLWKPATEVSSRFPVNRQNHW